MLNTTSSKEAAIAVPLSKASRRERNNILMNLIKRIINIDKYILYALKNQGEGGI